MKEVKVDINKLSEDMNKYLCKECQKSEGGDFRFPDEIMKQVFIIRENSNV